MTVQQQASVAERRYDRQVRIWGAHGQAALQNARVCLLNAGPTGSEALKNLVLGGIANFSIVDAGVVTSADLGNNFMLEPSLLGTSRAEAVASLLRELNESVAGGFVDEQPAALVAMRPSFFGAFDIVIATQMRELELLALEQVTRRLGVHLLVVRAYGLIGYTRASIAEHWVVESKPDNVAEDLRLSQPWPELAAFADSLELANMDDVTHKHVPYALLLIKAAQAWKCEHGGQLPASSNERSQFKQLLRTWQRSLDGITLEEENFSEAISNAHKMWASAGIGSEVSSILADPAANVEAESADFWFMLAALKAFVETDGGGHLPLEGSIPDMTATTELYLQLQRIYKAKADADAAAVSKHLQGLLAARGRNADAISEAAVKHFSRNSRAIRLVRCRWLAEELDKSSVKSEAVRTAFSSEGTATNAALYVLLRAADRFAEQHKRAPGAEAADCAADASVLESLAAAVLAEVGAQDFAAAITDDLTGELCRFGASELHCVGAVMGGIAAQEAIKLITRQFVPSPGTVIYNAMSSTTSRLEF